MEMEQGQRVKWKKTGEHGTVKWATEGSDLFAVDWDDGECIEYNIDMSSEILPAN